MRQDRKTLIQYLILAVLILGTAYYFLFYSSFQGRKAELELQLSEKQAEWSSIVSRLAKENAIDEAILSNSEKIEKLSKKMFVNIEQEEALKLTNMLNKKGKLVFDTVTITEEFDSDLGTKILNETITFTADYDDVIDYLKYISSYNKNIAIVSANLDVSNIEGTLSIITEADIDSAEMMEVEDGELSEAIDIKDEEIESVEEITEEPSVEETVVVDDDSESAEENAETSEEFEMFDAEGGLLSISDSTTRLDVQLELKYRALPTLEELGVERVKLLNDIVNNRDADKGPFHMYPEYIIAKAAKEKEKETSHKNDDGKEYKPREAVLGFEGGQFFFVGSTPEMTGTALRSVIRIGGSYSADLNFDFLSPRDYNCANLVFEEDIFLQKQPESLVMQVYAFEVSDHKIGVVLVDSVGREYKVAFTDIVDWTEWKELKASLPDGISYPAKIQRIYVEGVGYDQKTRGRYLFDTMEVEYPLPEKTEDTQKD